MKKAFSIIGPVAILLGTFHANAFRLVDAETKAPLPLAFSDYAIIAVR